MDADWSVECAADDPLVVVPWKNAAGTITYIDLRAFPDALTEIPEARESPALAAALHRWNQSDSPIFTAKCDLWAYPADLFDAEDLPGFAFAHGGYIDLIQRAPHLFASFPLAEAQLRRWTEVARSLATPNARCEWTLRRAWIAPPEHAPDLPSSETLYSKGFATTLYVWGYGASPQAAAAAWASALDCLVDPVLTLGEGYNKVAGRTAGMSRAGE